MSLIHFRDKLPHASGICGAGWRDGLEDNGAKVKAVRTEGGVDCPNCLKSLHPGRRVARHGKVTVLFDPNDLIGMAELRIRGTGGDETTVEVPLMHLLGTALKVVQNVAEVIGEVAGAVDGLTALTRLPALNVPERPTCHRCGRVIAGVPIVDTRGARCGGEGDEFAEIVCAQRAGAQATDEMRREQS